VTDWSQVGPLFWLLLPLRLPGAVLRSARQVVALGGLGPAFATRFRQQVLPAFLDEVRRAAADNIASLDDTALRGRLEHWVRRTLYDFARDGLKPTVRAAIARENLQRWLQRKLGPDRGREAVNELCMGVKPDPEADLPGAVRDLMAGTLDRAAFLDRFGHRGEQEMELSRPRWREDPAALDRLASQHAEVHTAGAPAAGRWEAIAEEAKLSKLERAALDPEVQILHTSLALRETAKHYLLHGFDLMRRVLLEIDRRHRLHGGVFYLTPEELPRLGGEDLAGVITQRRRRRTLCLSLEAPPVLFSDDLEALGRAVRVAGCDSLQGVPLSAGSADAPALVLEQPRVDEVPAEPYILVCPSTDPAWVPLFVRARGLVMERGGVLSHGAIVAREYGLPAVAGLPGVQRRLRTGQRLRVDGGRGTVTVLP
jgi:pyruvate,water dikinase